MVWDERTYEDSGLMTNNNGCSAGPFIYTNDISMNSTSLWSVKIMLGMNKFLTNCNFSLNKFKNFIFFFNKTLIFITKI
jgi:hypothetical protein